MNPNFPESRAPFPAAPALSSKEAAAAAAAGLPRLTPQRERAYKERSPDQLVIDVSRLADQQYDMSGRLRRERDTADKKLLEAEQALGWADIKIYILTGAVTALFAIVLALWEKMPK